MAQFKTAFSVSRAIVVDSAVHATVQADDAATTALAKAFNVRQATPNALTALKVGDLVTHTPATATLPATTIRTLSLNAATHMVAQGDMSQEYGHAAIERSDYRYLPMINGTYTGTLAAATPVKKVTLFKLEDKSDVMIDASQGETL